MSRDPKKSTDEPAAIDLKKNAYPKADAEVYRDRLKLLRARLKGDVDYLTESALRKNRAEGGTDHSTMPIHMAEVGSDNFELEFSLSLLEAEQDTLAEIESALERIAQGVYGSCVECGARIKKSRLNAIPFTQLCIDCATLRDQ